MLSKVSVHDFLVNHGKSFGKCIVVSYIQHKLGLYDCQMAVFKHEIGIVLPVFLVIQPS